MARRYHGAPVDDVRTGVADDTLTNTVSAGAAPTGTGALTRPETNRGASLDYHRPPLGTGLTTPPQHVIGVEVKQSGAGRAHVRPELQLPEQSPTPIPDGRRIARPMPTAAYDADQVIRPGGAS